MAKKKPKDTPRRGRPPKPPEERIRLAKYCQSSFPPEVVAWLTALDPTGRSRNTGLNALVWREFRRATAENPGKSSDGG